MNYQKHYYNLIERAKSRILEGYVEKHHIVPKCVGGADDIENLVALTPEEHYIAHQLLVKIYPDNHKLVYAARMMTVSKKGMRNNNKLFGWLKRKYALSSRSIKRNPPRKSTKPRKPRAKETKPRNRDYTMSEKQKLKISESLMKLNYHHTTEAKEKIRNSNIVTKAAQKAAGIKRSPSTTPRKKHSQEAKLKMSMSQKGKLKPQKTVTCPFCEKIGAINNMRRYHFDNCPKNT
jgi:hypothetical protein